MNANREPSHDQEVLCRIHRLFDFLRLSPLLTNMFMVTREATETMYNRTIEAVQMAP